jgi:PAS domain S-box-containing protein
MRIRTLLGLTLAVFFTLLAALGVASLMLAQQLTDVLAAQSQIRKASLEINDLLVHAHEYARYGEDRSAEQWHERLVKLGKIVATDNAQLAADQPKLPVETRQIAATLSELFENLKLASQSPADPLQLRRKQLLLDQMLINVSLLVETVERRDNELHLIHYTLHQRLQWADRALILLMAALLVSVAGFVLQRVLRPLAQMQAAVHAIERGDLTVRAASTANDELGELARAFDTMAVEMVSNLRRQVAEREAAEANAHKVSRLYAVLSRCNHAIVHSRDTNELLQTACHAAVSLGGMKMAWIGMVDAETQLLRPVASFGDEAGYLATVQISVVAGSVFGQGPTGTAIRDDQPFWCDDLQTNSRTVPWHEAAAQAGWQASAALPLHRDGRAIGALNLYAGDADAFDDDVRKLLLELADDLSFALGVFARDAERLQIAGALQESEAMFSLLLRQTPIYVFIKEVSASESRVLRVSDNFIKMVGIASADMIGKTMEELFPPEVAAKFTADDWAVVSKGEVLTLEETLNGRTYSTIKFPIVEAGRSLLAGYTIDTTDSKRADQRMHSQLDELRRWQQVMLGREERILAMKREVNALLAEQGQPPRYPSALDEGEETAR